MTFEEAAENTHIWQLSNPKDCPYVVLHTTKTSLLSIQMLEFKQVTLNCVRERKCFMLFCCTQWSKSFNCLLFYWIWHSFGVECCSDSIFFKWVGGLSWPYTKSRGEKAEHFDLKREVKNSWLETHIQSNTACNLSKLRYSLNGIITVQLWSYRQ